MAKTNLPLNLRQFLGSTNWWSLPPLRPTLLALVVTITTTSTFNVAFIHLAMIHWGFSEATYGLIVSALSIGLALGPLTVSKVLLPWGLSRGACLCAAWIGLSLVMVTLTNNPAVLFLILLGLGLANGSQNTLMSTLTMTLIPEKDRPQLMPTYTFVVQSAVLIGFIIGGLVPLAHAETLLLVSGSIATLAGLGGTLTSHTLKTKEATP